MAQTIVGLLILYACRLFERQLGVRKFGAFFCFSLFVSIAFQVCLAVISDGLGVHFVPASGPYFLIFALLFLYYAHIPKTVLPNFTFLGFIAISEKSWIYLLALQLLFSNGLSSVSAAVGGLLAGALYEQDGFNIQSWRLPTAIENTCALFGRLVALLVPSRTPTGGIGVGAGVSAGAGATGTGAQILNRGGDARSGALFRRGGGGGGGFASNPGAAWTADAQQGMDAYGGFGRPLPDPPSEEAIASLTGLGFERSAVLQALQTTDNNLEAAANLLLSR